MPRKCPHGDACKGREKGIHAVWRAMKDRCENPRCRQFVWYGERGIKVHPEWSQSYVAFRDGIYALIGERPSGAYTLDRIDTNGNYEPGNVRWATRAEQARNQRNTKLSEEKVKQIKQLVAVGRSQASVAVLFGVNPSTVSRVVNDLRWAA